MPRGSKNTENTCYRRRTSPFRSNYCDFFPKCQIGCLVVKYLSFCVLLIVACGTLADASLQAQEKYRLEETFAKGSIHQVSMRVDLQGVLSLPSEDDKKSQENLRVSGKSSIDYQERFLKLGKKGNVEQTIRIYQQMDFQRKVGKQLQENQLRSPVRRLVILRKEQIEVPFSPDGPLTWGEIDLVRTDVFVPALSGLLPANPVAVGDRWAAATDAIQELTDFRRIDEGGLVCRLQQITNIGQQKLARISFSGTIRGLSEDGISKQRLDGYLYFDMGTNSMSYMSMLGTHFLLDKEGTVVGQVTGDFVMTRQMMKSAEKLSDADLRGVTLEPNADNTLLMHEDADLGIRFFYPRRWRVAGTKGQQIGLDEKGGSGILITVEPATRTPSGQQFLRESRQWLENQKAQIRNVQPVRVIQRSPQLENFSLDVKVGKEPIRMDYYVMQGSKSGVVVAARLLLGNMSELQREVLQITRSIQLINK